MLPMGELVNDLSIPFFKPKYKFLIKHNEYETFFFDKLRELFTLEGIEINSITYKFGYGFNFCDVDFNSVRTEEEIIVRPNHKFDKKSYEPEFGRTAVLNCRIVL